MLDYRMDCVEMLTSYCVDAKIYLSIVNLNIRINVKIMMRLASFRVYPLFLFFTTKNVKGASPAFSSGVNGISLNYSF